MSKEKKMSVLLVNPGEAPKMVEIDDTLEAMQNIVGGMIEQYMPFEDEVAIICNEEGKFNGMKPNRIIYSEPEKIEMSYNELKDKFRQAEENGQHITGYITFTADSFNKPYSEESRTYAVSSDNKAFIKGMGGYSIFGSALDGSDNNVRLDQYMYDEYGTKTGWKVERCYIKDESKNVLDVIFGPFFVCYAPFESESFERLPENLAEKYAEIFKNPDGYDFLLQKR